MELSIFCVCGLFDTEWANGTELDNPEASNRGDPLFDLIDELFALLAIG